MLKYLKRKHKNNKKLIIIIGLIIAILIVIFLPKPVKKQKTPEKIVKPVEKIKINQIDKKNKDLELSLTHSPLPESPEWLDSNTEYNIKFIIEYKNFKIKNLYLKKSTGNIALDNLLTDYILKWEFTGNPEKSNGLVELNVNYEID